MRRYGTLTALALAGCSLIVPAEDEFTYDLADGGGPPIDSGSDRDAEVRFDGGADAGPACGAEETRCDGTCVDTQSSLQHCGDCGNACAPTDRCDAGACYDPVLEVAAGFGHTCARRASGQVWCWGLNANGQLGDGTTLDRLTPVRVLELDDAMEIGCGIQPDRLGLSETGYSCARLSSGLVRCWGANFTGQLGDGTLEDRQLPVDVMGLGVVDDIGVGAGIGCAVSADQRLHCWGGLDDASNPRPPSLLAPDGVSAGWAEQVEMGVYGGCVIASTGRVYCWGSNSHGQLGSGTAENVSQTPVAVVDVSNAISSAVSLRAACALASSGDLVCWGQADRLGAGLGTTEPHPSPVAVPGLSDVAAIEAGGATCAIHGSDRRVSCWGDEPSLVDGLSGVVDLAVGITHICAALEDGSVRCWGANESGQLGDGTTTERPEPAPVVGLR